ncbi:hypothetical protein [Streptomyces sp. NPDC058157]|uniref:hypothetical protein n=1 Tax=Streptomyces sp. NPDC058157 TaxID=3346360 RepID=UPI0036DFE565
MDREERRAVVGAGLSWAVWGTLIWIVTDSDLQGVQDAIGWWILALALAPVVLMAVWLVVSDEPRAPADDCDSDGVHWTHGPDGCGSARYGCGG